MQFNLEFRLPWVVKAMLICGSVPAPAFFTRVAADASRVAIPFSNVRLPSRWEPPGTPDFAPDPDPPLHAFT